ncbi:MAG: response regulator transcription factor [Leptospirales bacterium]|nr:response regulator transcription factor [Leptospirales bacterium]
MSGPVQYTVGIVENDELFREELRRRLAQIPEVRQICEWPSAEQFLRDPLHRNVEILLLDIMLSGISGIQLVSELSRLYPEMRVVMVTNMHSDSMVFESIKGGALGYILKSELGDLGAALRIVSDGGALITPTIALRVFSSFRRSSEESEVELTDRERQVLQLMVKGKTIQSVATFLQLSEHTVHGYVKSIYKKLKVHNRAQLATRAHELSLL